MAAAAVLTPIAVSSATPAQAAAKTSLVVTSKKVYAYNYETGGLYLDTVNTQTYKSGYQVGSFYASYGSDGEVMYLDKEVTKYDKKHRTTMYAYYTKDGLNSKSTYTYKKKNVTIKHYGEKNNYTGKEVVKNTKKKTTVKSYNAKGSLQYTEVTKYDKKGRFLSSVRKKGKKVLYTSKSTYKKGKLAKESSIWKKTNGKTEYKITKTYNKGVPVKDVYEYYDTNGKLASNQTVTYAKGIQKSMVLKSYDNGKLQYTLTEKYNAKGKIIESTDAGYNSKKQTYKNRTTYTYKGAYTTERTYYDGTLSSESKYRMDKADNRIYSYTKYFYEYDGQTETRDCTYKYTMNTTGAIKGTVKRELKYEDGKLTGRTDYVVKAIKIKEPKSWR